jgi:hypothetical protein
MDDPYGSLFAGFESGFDGHGVDDSCCSAGHEPLEAI